MPTYDYGCKNGHDFEVRCSIADRPQELSCPTCGGSSHQVILQAPKLFTTIVPDYPGSKKLKAGYTLSHADKNATKTLSGPYGMVQKKEIDPNAPRIVAPDFRPKRDS